MRFVAWVSFPFALGCALCAYLTLPLPAAGVAAGVLAAASIALGCLRQRRLRSAVCVLAGLAAGILWTGAFDAAFYDVPAAESAAIEGTVIAAPVRTDYGAYAFIRTELAGRSIKARLYYDDPETELRPGDSVAAEGRIRAVRPLEDSSDLTFAAYGCRAALYAKGALTVTRPERAPLRCRPALWRMAVQEKLASVFPADTAGFMTALLTGERSGLSDEAAADLRICGVYHVVSVSGMHVSILLGFLLFALRGRRRRALIGVPAAVLFIAFIGGTPGVMRAGIVYAFALAAPLFSREADSPTSLGAALALMLLADPFSIANIGLQLSFAATAGILLLYVRLNAALACWCRVEVLQKRSRMLARMARFFLGVLATTASALVLTTPLMAYWFGTVSLIGPLANLLIVPVVSVCFILGIAAAAAAFACMPAALAIAWADSRIVRYVLAVCRVLARAPYAQIGTASPYVQLWLLFAYAVVVSLCVCRPLRKRPVIPLCSVALTLILSLALTGFSRTGASVTALDVGQGQCIVLESGGVRTVVDCGGSSAPGEACAQFLKDGGAETVDALIITHFDSDHTCGVAELFHRMEVAAVYVPAYADEPEERDAVLSAAEAAGAAVYVVTEDLRLPGGVTAFAPVSRGSDNRAGLCVLFTGGLNALITGDMDADLEERLLSLHEIPDLDVLIAGHHGSKYATGAALLAQTTPEVVLVSVGQNRYGHPAEETLRRIADAGAEAFRTDQCGNITVRR